MDDADGERHPEWAFKAALYLFKDAKWAYLCLYHSRHYARNAGVEPSLLCWADKMSILFERWWTYLPRAWASGELSEYRNIAYVTGFVLEHESHREWFKWIQDRLTTLGREKRGDVVPYVNPERTVT